MSSAGERTAANPTIAVIRVIRMLWHTVTEVGGIIETSTLRFVDRLSAWLADGAGTGKNGIDKLTLPGCTNLAPRSHATTLLHSANALTLRFR